MLLRRRGAHLPSLLPAALLISLVVNALTPWLVAYQDVAEAVPTFYRDVLPILQEHCQKCHQPGEIGPMPLTSYKEVRPWAAAIRESVKLRQMPPWFADPQHGRFANDARLSNEAIARIERWVKAGAPAGVKSNAPLPVNQPVSIPFSADLTLTIPKAVAVPAKAVLDYQYIVLPLPFTSEQWVRGIQIKPSDRSVVHHAVLYVRSSESRWLREAQPGVPYAPPRANADAVRRTRDTKEEILAIYTPGASATVFPEGMAKKIPAGADLVLQLHYTSKQTHTTDKPTIALSLLPHVPQKRLLTLQMGRDDLRIPPVEREYRISVSGTLPADALLVSLFPHMHLRGSAFDFEVLGPGGQAETLLRVKPYQFHWQLNYVLQSPRLLRKGTRLRWTGYFDNSPNNPNNPDPAAEVAWGEQSWDEMMIGFFDIAVDPDVDKEDYFVR